MLGIFLPSEKISIHAPLRERPISFTTYSLLVCISIHAPLRERPRLKAGWVYRTKISIHAPLRERPPRIPSLISCIEFQSTLPYGSDCIPDARYLRGCNFNPRSLTGATQLRFQQICLLFISIHAPLRERLSECRGIIESQHFNPRSLTGATISGTKFKTLIGISIHAPLRERLTTPPKIKFRTWISIHAPLRERPPLVNFFSFGILFQSTLPYGSDKQSRLHLP